MTRRHPIPTWFFALVVVRHRDRFLLIQERRHDQRWYLPAGRVEPAERLVDAAIRETLEESGVEIALDGVLQLQHTPSPRGTRVRVIFTGHPIGGTAGPTSDSLDARFVSPEEAATLPLRSPQVLRWLTLARRGDVVAPLEILGAEPG